MEESKFYQNVNSLEHGSEEWMKVMNLGNYWFTEGMDIHEKIEQYINEKQKEVEND